MVEYRMGLDKDVSTKLASLGNREVVVVVEP